MVFFIFIYILIDHDSLSKQWHQATPCADPEGGYMYLIFIMTGQDISNDSDKGVQIVH